MAQHRSRLNPLSQLMSDYCQLDPCEHISVKFSSKYNKFHARKWVIKCQVQNGCDFVPASKSKWLGGGSRLGPYRDWLAPSLCNRPLRSAGSPRLCLPQLAARACHHSLQILGDNPRAQKPPLWPLQKYSRMIHMCTRYLAHTQSGRNGHSIHPNEAHIFLKRGSQRSPHHGRYKMG